MNFDEATHHALQADRAATFGLVKQRRRPENDSAATVKGAALRFVASSVSAF
jgi:hypothetical protein